MAGLAVYPFSPSPEFRPHATTWLNQARWEVVADPYGLDEWLAEQSGDGMFSAAGWGREALVEVLQAAGLELTWRGDLAVLGAWVIGGYRPDSIALVVADEVAQRGVPSRLARLDWLVRSRAMRWDQARMEWVRGIRR